MAIESLYTLRTAAELIPMPSVSALRNFLYKHKTLFPSRCRFASNQVFVRKERLLSETEILKIREMTIRSNVRTISPLLRIVRQCAEVSS